MVFDNAKIEVQAIRVRLWYRLVLEKAGVRNAQELKMSCKRAGSLLADLGAIRWERHEAGQAPQNRQLDLVERVIPGTAALYLKGPFDLPLWNVLEGVEDVCLKVVDDFLAHQYRKPEEGKRLSVLESSNVMAAWFGVKPSESWDYEERFRLLTSCFTSISIGVLREYLKLSVNLYALAYKEYNTSVDIELPFSARSLLAAIAMWQLAMKCPVRSFREHAQYFLSGLNEEAIEYEFDEYGKDISEYVEKLLANSGVDGKLPNSRVRPRA